MFTSNVQYSRRMLADCGLKLPGKCLNSIPNLNEFGTCKLHRIIIWNTLCTLNNHFAARAMDGA